MRPQEPIASSSVIATSLSGQNLNLSELLAFDPASIGSAILEADDLPLDSTSTANRLLHMRNLLSGPIDALI
jgi:phosphomevalonate kinase